MNFNILDFAAIIPARKGSKRIRGKNTVLINRKPLIKFTIDAALKSKKIKLIIISTNDRKILSLRSSYKNVIFIKRPESLCKDNSSTESAMLHTIKYLERKKIKVKNLILLQSTSPFRDHKDIDDSVDIFKKKKLDSLVSVNKKKIFLWKKNKDQLIPITYDYKNRKMTQKMKYYFVENGAIFISSVEKLKKTKSRLFKKIGYIEMNQFNSLEIDDKDDLKYARHISKII